MSELASPAATEQGLLATMVERQQLSAMDAETLEALMAVKNDAVDGAAVIVP